jgi:D-serine deaminase-like pyridoxal phosphate-dependent protein
MTGVSAGRAGSHMLLDAAYDRLGLAFEPAPYCVSRAEPTRVVLDAGLKALAVDEGLPVPAAPGLRVVGRRARPARRQTEDRPGHRGQDLPDRVAHRPTVNLHDALFVYDGQGLERWPVGGRRVSTLPDLQDLPR